MRSRTVLVNGGIAAPLLQRLIIRSLELGKEVVLVEREMLRQRDGDELLSRINLAVSRRCAIPAELPDRRWNGESAPVSGHFDAQSKAFLSRGRLVVRKGLHVIGRHQFDGLAAENPVALERAAVAVHLG